MAIYDNLKEPIEEIEIDKPKQISSTEREKLLMKTARNLPDNPANSGMRASAVKPKFYQSVTDLSDSLYAYFNRAITTINETFSKLENKINDDLNKDKAQKDNIIDNLSVFKQEYINYVNTTREELDKILKSIDKEIEDRTKDVDDEETARIESIINLINGASAEYDTLSGLETKIKTEVSERTSAIENLIDNASDTYNTLKKIQIAIELEIKNRNTAVTNERLSREEAIINLVDNASSEFSTLKKIQGEIEKEISNRINAINQEIVDRNTAISVAVANLVNSSPEALDTLNELAEALGQDANFSATINNLIASKHSEAIAHTNTKFNEEKSARETAITNVVGGASAGYNSLKKLEDKINEEADIRAREISTEKGSRESAISGLINNASSGYDTLKGLETQLKNEVRARQTAVGEEATTRANAIDSEASARATKDTELESGINSLNNKVAVTDKNYDTLQKIQDILKSDGGDGIVALVNHLANSSNPHKVSASQVSCDYDGEATEVQKAVESLFALANTLSSDDKEFKTGLDTLIKRIITAEGRITTAEGDIDNVELRITSEVTNRKEAITSAINTEVTNRNNAITGAINTEVTNRNNAINNAVSGLKNEASTGYDTLKGLEEKIKAESSARISAINTEVTDRNTAISSAIANIVNGAPTTLDTLKELADAFANNKSLIDTLNSAVANHSHAVATTSASGFMSASDKSKLNGIASGANAYSHPTTTAVTPSLYKVGKDTLGHTVIGDSFTIPTSLPASDVYSWAKASSKPTYTPSEVGASPSNHTHSNATTSVSGFMSNADKTKLDGIASGANNYSHPTTTAVTPSLYKVGKDSSGHTVIGDSFTIPTSLPASDVYSWAKASSKPTYTASEVGASSSNHTHSQYSTTSHNHDSTYLKITNVLDKVYPIGAIYISYSSTSPANLFGGSWTAIQDRFLYSTGSYYSVGATGGSRTHTLTLSEMPSHSHVSYNDGGSTSYNQPGYANAWISSNGLAVSSLSTGGGQSHNNMPPFLVVYMWRRTA